MGNPPVPVPYPVPTTPDPVGPACPLPYVLVGKAGEFEGDWKGCLPPELPSDGAPPTAATVTVMY